ncbi:PEP/pyruvate-binding domain-containing protein [Saccharothrix coeruleofusca]|uniref:Pyruvate, phosphate dikinase n=1 Tax=Saccharothrix coeruleofusca TaxID=33919 RepID=A0A918EEL0_9PSEU|nr:PEP/pyruvate-binding domain-containing protein [Saccharothrix coeruleofusca]GGP66399.1 pyruvate, phosphate dikinase [Saccharothrix coeruleofusca]
MEAVAFVRPLDEVGLGDVAEVGHKSAVLGELSAAGLPVPPGWVLTADALDRALAAGPVDRRDGPELPDDVACALAAIAEELGERPVAVRSSATDEDLVGTSYAGQYESVLGVRGPTALGAAVRACWASAFTDRVAVYEGARGDGAGRRRMGVLIQRMLRAEAAGVAFSADPVTGRRDQVRISAVRGLGDRLAAGRSDAEEWSVVDDMATLVTGARDALTPARALLVAELARHVEQRFGRPQDIEWAFADGRLWLLQARPITALPDPPPRPAGRPVQPPPGFWRRSNYAARPLSPMARSTVLRGQADNLRHLLAYSLGQSLELREIGGWLYSRFAMPDGPAGFAAKLNQVMAAVRADEPAGTVRRWHADWLPRLGGALERERDEVDPAALDDDQLRAHLTRLLELAHEASEAHFRIGGAGMLALGELGLACAELLGWDTPSTLVLLTGLPGRTTEPSHRLAELVRLAEGEPALRALLADDRTPSRSALAAASPAFAEAFDRYLRDCALRAAGLDIANPTMAETPELVLALVRGRLDQGFDPAEDALQLVRQRAGAVARARAELARTPEHLPRFNRALRRAQAAYPLRDDSGNLAKLAAALIRRAVLVVGDRLVARGLLDRVDEVFLLELPEALAALAGGERPDGIVRARAAELAWAQANPGPPSYGRPPEGPGGPPAAVLEMLPEDARLVVRAGMWVWREAAGNLAKHEAHDGGSGSAVRGIPASAGRYTGPVRVIVDESGFGALRPGDVLVCPQTTAEWSVLFPNIGALVTDQGGLLSHPAIIAREYRVPAVVATGDATRLLTDDQVVTVDGGAGVVEPVTGPR